MIAPWLANDKIRQVGKNIRLMFLMNTWSPSLPVS